jgi:hypothetical protein
MGSNGDGGRLRGELIGPPLFPPPTRGKTEDDRPASRRSGTIAGIIAQGGVAAFGLVSS